MSGRKWYLHIKQARTVCTKGSLLISLATLHISYNLQNKISHSNNESQLLHFTLLHKQRWREQEEGHGFISTLCTDMPDWFFRVAFISFMLVSLKEFHYTQLTARALIENLCVLKTLGTLWSTVLKKQQLQKDHHIKHLIGKVAFKQVPLKALQGTLLLTGWRWAVPCVMIQSMEVLATLWWKCDWPCLKTSKS